MTARTLYDKHIDSHTVCSLDDQGHVLLYIDRQVINEYTSPQAFSGLREAGRTVWRPGTALAVVDHVNPTTPKRIAAMPDAGGARQVSYLAENCRDFGIELLDILDKRQGIEHVIAPEQGFILPGMVIAAGDSHTTTYGALGAFGFGIGTSEIEHLLASQTLVYKRLKTLRVTVDGDLAPGLTSKDVIMALIGKIGASGATGYAIARGAFMAPDEKVFDYLKGKPRAPQGELWEKALLEWRKLHTDEDAVFDREVQLDASTLEPMVTWGTSPDQAAPIGARVPDPQDVSDLILRQDMRRALNYMGLEAGMPLSEIVISHAFIGSCTNARIEDLRDAASVVRGKHVADHVRAMIVPGSTEVRDQAEAEGLAAIFIEAGFEWRQSGCSMCLAMNDDVLAPGDRCASSTNRNFEGRQGAGARTHLMSPAMVAAAAITGRLTDIRHFGARP